jgi:hypothetical protein
MTYMWKDVRMFLYAKYCSKESTGSRVWHEQRKNKLVPLQKVFIKVSQKLSYKSRIL